MKNKKELIGNQTIPLLSSWCVSEIVSLGHPDKIADQIADLLLDLYLSADSEALVACEVMVTGKRIVIGGEINSRVHFDSAFLRQKISVLLEEIGYLPSVDPNFNFENFQLDVFLQKQSAELAQIQHRKICSGDQAVVFGYACNSNSYFLPWSYLLAREIATELDTLRLSKKVTFLRPDFKVLVCLKSSSSNPHSFISVNCQHTLTVTISFLKSFLWKEIVVPILEKHSFKTEGVEFFVNSGGSFLTGGPVVDTGMTGRKLMHDTFGTSARHGGGSFSGKDATKIDRLGSLLARYIAKNVVASGLMVSCEVQLVFLIGEEHPLLIDITGQKSFSFSKHWLCKIIKQIFNQEIEKVISLFSLRQPRYLNLTQKGVFLKRTLPVAWEETDKADALSKTYHKWKQQNET